jgi:glutathione S-transferase
MDVSHPSQAARAMLELKGLEFRLVNVLPTAQRFHLRLAGFRGGTVPALRLGHRRVQGSRQIARVLDQLEPEPALFPAEAELRARVEEAERWGEAELQPVPRRLARWAAARQSEVRRWVAQHRRLPLPGLAGAASGPVTRWYCRANEPDGRIADDPGVRADLAALPALLDHVDALIAEGTVTLQPPNAATLQILASVRMLAAMHDLDAYTSGRESVRASRELFPGYPDPFPAAFPREWMPLASTG